MSPAAAALLTRVRAAGGELEAQGDRLKVRAPSPLPAELVDALRTRKAEVLAALQTGPPPPTYTLDDLRRRIRCARDRHSLYSVLGDDVDDLYEMARQEAQGLPERRSKREPKS